MAVLIQAGLPFDRLTACMVMGLGDSALLA
jgi:hypothetical protein